MHREVVMLACLFMPRGCCELSCDVAAKHVFYKTRRRADMRAQA
jgi:hypothetical protein